MYHQTLLCRSRRGRIILLRKIWVLFRPLVSMFPSTFEWFGFPIFWFWACNLMKVIPVTCHARTCWMLFQKHVMHVPVEGYSRNMSCTYLLEVIPETCHARTCWRLFQKHVMHVPVEGYSRNMSCTYLMKVIPETGHARTWWRLFQKHVMHTNVDIYVLMTITRSIPLLVD